MVIKTIDSKGRVALGAQFAGQQVIIREIDGEIVLTPAVIIPQREAWLYKNDKALEAVRTGLAQASDGRFSHQPPDLDSDKQLAGRIND
jgi:hypothetical protein